MYKARLVALVVLHVGCQPLSPILPFHVAETPEVLRPRKVSFSFAAGAGTMGADGWGSGGTMRLRVGVRKQQEVGIEAGAIYAHTGDPSARSPPWIGTPTAYGAKLSWKGAPVPWFAVLAGAGASSATTGAAAGADLGVIFSSDHAFGGWFRPYGAARAAFALPIDHDIDQAGGATVALVLPGGVSFQPSQWIRLFVEFGGIVAWSNVGSDPDKYNQPPYPDMQPYRSFYGPAQHGGYYGAFGVTFILGRNTDQAWFLKGLQDFR